MTAASVVAPRAATLTDGERSLIQFGLLVSVLCFGAMLTRLWSARREVGERFRPAVHSGVAICTVALLSSVMLLLQLQGSYHRAGGVWVPSGTAIDAWTVRYADWAITVPLLVVQIVAVSTVVGRAALRAKLIGAGAAALMAVLGYVGFVVVGRGHEFGALLGFGLAASICFVAVCVVIGAGVVRSLPVLPAAARGQLTGAMVVLLSIWFVCPVVYGLQGAASGGAITATEQLLLCGADIVAKVVAGLLILRVARIRTAADAVDGEDVHPESIWIDQRRQSEGASRPVRSRA